MLEREREYLASILKCITIGSIELYQIKENTFVVVTMSMICFSWSKSSQDLLKLFFIIHAFFDTFQMDKIMWNRIKIRRIMVESRYINVVDFHIRMIEFTYFQITNTLQYEDIQCI